MLGVIYAMVAVGFTLFFGVLDVIKFSHGDVLTVGAFTGLATYAGMQAAGIASPLLQLLAVVLAAVAAMALLGAAIAKYLVLPLRTAPPLNTLLHTLMLGSALRECERLFYPQGANPKPFPRLLPQDAFALGSGLAALAGIMNGLYYSEINFSIGLLLGVIGFSAAVVGGLGNIYGAILGGFLFAGLQTLGAVLLPALLPEVPSAYKDVFAFAAVIAFMAWRPTGLIAEKIAERV